MHQVAVRAELLVRDGAAVRGQRAARCSPRRRPRAAAAVALAAPRSTSLSPTFRPSSRGELVHGLRAGSLAAPCRSDSGTSARSAVVAGVEEGARVEALEARLHARRPARATESRRPAGRALGVEEQVGAAEVAARVARLGLGGLDRSGGQRLEHVLDDVLGREPLDQRGLLQSPRPSGSPTAREQLRVVLARSGGRGRCRRGCRAARRPPPAARPAARRRRARPPRPRPARPRSRRIRSSSSAARPGRGVASGASGGSDPASTSSSASGSRRQIWQASAPSSWRAPRVTAS